MRRTCRVTQSHFGSGGYISFKTKLYIYHFGFKVFDILRVENGHERLSAHSLAAVFLSHHQRYVLWVVLKVVDERLALAPYGLTSEIHIIRLVMSDSTTSCE